MFQTHSIRLPVPLLERLKLRAATNRRSFNGELIYIIEQFLETQEAADSSVVKELLKHHSEAARSAPEES